MILLSTAYAILIHLLTRQFSLNEIALSWLFDTLCLSTIVWPSSITMNAGWYFQCLVQFWFVAPFINILLNKYRDGKSCRTQVLILIGINLCYYLSVLIMHSYTEIYYNSFIRIFEITVGMTLYDFMEVTSEQKVSSVAFTAAEIVSLVVLFYPFIRNLPLEHALTNIGLSTFLLSIAVFVFGCNRGCISTFTSLHYKLAELMAGYSFDVYIFHFTVLHYLSLSPLTGNRYVLLFGSFLVPILIGKMVNHLGKILKFIK